MTSPATTVVSRLTFAAALAATAVGLAPRAAFAQADAPDAPAAPRNPSERLEPIAADGFAAFMDLMEEFARAQFEKLPSSDKSARENAYGKLAALQLAGAGSALVLPAAGLAIGGGIGLIVDLSTAGADLGTGSIVGGSIGLGSGIVVGGGAFVASLIATLPMVDEIEAKYPAEAAAGGAQFIATGNTLTLAGAGLFESYYVNLVSSLPDQFVTLIERWDRTPGLGANERAWLASIAFARPHLQRLAWIKRNQRVSANAPVANDMFMDVGRILSGDQGAMERAWLTALGLGATGLELKHDKLTLDVPQPLRAFGLPARLSANVPDLNVRVGGNGGAFDPFMRFKLDAGPFDINWGTVSVVKSGSNKDLVAVEYSIARGARLGAARVTFKAGGDETKVVDLRPALDRTLKGTLFFSLRGLALEFKKAELGGLELSFGVPREIRELPIVKDLLNGLLADVERELRKFLRDTVPFAGLFDGFGRGSVSALAASVKRDAGSHGLTSISAVTEAEVVNGVVKLHVRGRALRQPELGDSVAAAQKEWARLGGAGRAKLQPSTGLRPRTAPGRAQGLKPAGAR
ncbi:MAG: hypothetical protein R3F49_18400 [Planctomycetota bacterium]